MSTAKREINQAIKPFFIQEILQFAKKPAKMVNACLGSKRCGMVLIKSKHIVGSDTSNHKDENHTSNLSCCHANVNKALLMMY